MQLFFRMSIKECLRTSQRQFKLKFHNDALKLSVQTGRVEKLKGNVQIVEHDEY